MVPGESEAAAAVARAAAAALRGLYMNMNIFSMLYEYDIHVLIHLISL